MSSKSTIYDTNDHAEEAFFDGNAQMVNKYGLVKDEITLSFDKENIRVDRNNEAELIFSITNPDSEIYKIFERLCEIVPKANK